MVNTSRFKEFQESINIRLVPSEFIWISNFVSKKVVLLRLENYQEYIAMDHGRVMVQQITDVLDTCLTI